MLRSFTSANDWVEDMTMTMHDAIQWHISRFQQAFSPQNAVELDLGKRSFLIEYSPTRQGMCSSLDPRTLGG